jgi:hypothetical protein
MLNYMDGILHEPFESFYVGIAVENVTARDEMAREMQGAVAVESQKRVARAVKEGRLISEIVRVRVPSRKEQVVSEIDEHIRADVTMEQLAKLQPAFYRNVVVTAGKSSGIKDATAAVVVAFIEKVPALSWRFPSTTQSARPAPSSPGRRPLHLPGEEVIEAGQSRPKRSTNCIAPAEGMPWQPCASAAVRESRQSSNASDPAAGRSKALCMCTALKPRCRCEWCRDRIAGFFREILRPTHCSTRQPAVRAPSG